MSNSNTEISDRNLSNNDNINKFYHCTTATLYLILMIIFCFFFRPLFVLPFVSQVFGYNNIVHSTTEKKAKKQIHISYQDTFGFVFQHTSSQ